MHCPRMSEPLHLTHRVPALSASGATQDVGRYVVLGGAARARVPSPMYGVRSPIADLSIALITDCATSRSRATRTADSIDTT